MILAHWQVGQGAGGVGLLLPVCANQAAHVLALGVVAAEPLLEVVLVSIPTWGGREEVERVVPLLAKLAPTALLLPLPSNLVLTTNPGWWGRKSSVVESETSPPLSSRGQPAHQPRHPPGADRLSTRGHRQVLVQPPQAP